MYAHELVDGISLMMSITSLDISMVRYLNLNQFYLVESGLCACVNALVHVFSLYTLFSFTLLSILLLISGASTCEHLLGNSYFRRVQEIIEKNLCTAHKHVAHVYSCCRCSDGIIWASEMIMQLQCPRVLKNRGDSLIEIVQLKHCRGLLTG